MKVRSIGPFVILGLAAVLVFGVVVPTVERVTGRSADSGAPKETRRESEDVVRLTWPDAEECFALSPSLGPRPGRIVIRAHVEPSGVVDSLAVRAAPAHSERTCSCLMQVVREWSFDQTRAPRWVSLVYDPQQHAYDPSMAGHGVDGTSGPSGGP